MKKQLYIGFDTSNYTTSLAICDENKNVLTNLKCPLPVKKGERGLRQSEAVFAHIKNSPEIARALRSFLNGLEYEAEFAAAAVSASPRDVDGSYMPCFLVGEALADTVTSFLSIPLYKTSHQAGHIIAATASALKASDVPLEEFLLSEYLALHVSGGTTDLLRVTSDEKKIIDIEHIGGSLDANAGQIIDRIGVKLDFPFPCGPYIDALALEHKGKVKGISLSVKGTSFNLSGLENKAASLIENGAETAEVSAYVLEFISRSVRAIVENAFESSGKLPVVFAGGVMSSRYIKGRLNNVGYFSEPQFSSDNAAGVAILASLLHNRNKEGK